MYREKSGYDLAKTRLISALEPILSWQVKPLCFPAEHSNFIRMRR